MGPIKGWVSLPSRRALFQQAPHTPRGRSTFHNSAGDPRLLSQCITTGVFAKRIFDCDVDLLRLPGFDRGAAIHISIGGPWICLSVLAHMPREVSHGPSIPSVSAVRLRIH